MRGTTARPPASRPPVAPWRGKRKKASCLKTGRQVTETPSPRADVLLDDSLAAGYPPSDLWERLIPSSPAACLTVTVSQSVTSSHAVAPLPSTGAEGVQTLGLCGGLSCGNETTSFL